MPGPPDPEFLGYQAEYLDPGATSAADTIAKDDLLFEIPKEWETFNVLLKRAGPVKMTAPGAAGRRIGGTPDEQLGPTYSDGAKQVTLANLLRDYYRADSKTLASYQQALWLGGFYEGKATPTFGVPDERGFAAFRKAGLRAARSGKTFSETLQEAAASGAAGAEDERGPLTVRLTNPADISRMAQAAAREVLGQNASAEQVQSIVRRYQQAERTYQADSYRDAATGGTAVAPPSLEAFSLDAVEQADPVGAEAYRGADAVMGSLFRVLEGPLDG